MSQIKVLSLQVLVAVVAMVADVLTTVPIGGVKLLPPFFFSNPEEVAARVVDGSRRARSGSTSGSRWSRRCWPSWSARSPAC